MKSINLLVVLSLFVSSLFIGGCQSWPGQQRTFASPQAAADALADAAKARDRKQIRSLFGPEIERLHSGDERQDDEDLQRFSAAYDRKHDLQKGADGQYTLLVGEEYWEFPAPIIEENGKWMFDTEAGVDEMISRRIGRNELATINTCKALVLAQRDYWQLDPDGDGKCQYASKLASSEGKKDGLYWPAGENEDQSPLGPAVAEAVQEGALKKNFGKPQPYKGYYYRVLKQQSAGAPGGAMSYFDENGQMTKGFAIIAWPEEYEETGIMSFLVTVDGVVKQRDLGDNTEATASTIDSYDPTGWEEVK